jgi:hypothetical protein
MIVMQLHPLPTHPKGRRCCVRDGVDTRMPRTLSLFITEPLHLPRALSLNWGADNLHAAFNP